ncbi:hypothetical protein CBL_12087 [Carabus blaptoides fortunei]
MGFADDIVLLENTDTVMALSLAICSSFMLIRRSAKKILHLSGHTGNRFLHAFLRDGGLGLTQLRMKIPNILRTRLANLFASDPISATLQEEEPTASFVVRVACLSGKGTPDAYWREEISTRPFSAGLEAASEDKASRSWLSDTPPGWTGRDFVRVVQLRTNNLPCRGLPSNPAEQLRCRAGCEKVESLSHILQGCPVTHYERLKRHNEIVSKIASMPGASNGPPNWNHTLR